MFLQLKLDMYKEFKPGLSSEKLNSTRMKLGEIIDEEAEKIIRYYLFLQKLWNESDYYSLNMFLFYIPVVKILRTNRIYAGRFYIRFKGNLISPIVGYIEKVRLNWFYPINPPEKLVGTIASEQSQAFDEIMRTLENIPNPEFVSPPLPPYLPPTQIDYISHLIFSRNP